MDNHCRECGQPYTPNQKPGRHRTGFCGDPCRIAWHNRRKTRGAELYDFVMAWRYNRELPDMLAQLARLAAAYHAADTSLRDGRPSWHAGEALARLPLAYGRDGDHR